MRLQPNRTGLLVGTLGLAIGVLSMGCSKAPPDDGANARARGSFFGRRKGHKLRIHQADLIDNPIYGASARLSHYIRNDGFIGAATQAIENLKSGSQLLLFPEGTRTTRRPINRLKGGAALASKRSGVPIQTVLIETTSPFLSKGWPLHRIPPLPVRYRLRLGRRFMPRDNLRETMGDMEAYLESELGRGNGMDAAGEPLAQPQTTRLDER